MIDPTDGITWKGKHGNITYTQLEEILFENNYTSFGTKTSTTEEVFLLPHGKCKKLLGFNTTAKDEIRSREQSMLLIVDPNKENSIRIKEMENARVDLGPTNVNSQFFNFGDYELSITLHDKSIDDGKSCYDYEKLESSYGNCVEVKVKEYYLEKLGCLPPWLQLEE